MQLSTIENRTYKLDLNELESLITNNILNETAYGIRTDDFERDLGVSRDMAISVLNNFVTSSKTLICTLEELNFLKHAILFVIKDFILPEFHPRIGADLEEVLAYLENVIKVTEEVRLKTKS